MHSNKTKHAIVSWSQRIKKERHDALQEQRHAGQRGAAGGSSIYKSYLDGNMWQLKASQTFCNRTAI